MGRWLFMSIRCSIIILAGMLIFTPAIAETSRQFTELEKKLYEAAKKEGRVNYWDSLSLKEAGHFIKAFSKRYPGIEVSFWEGNAMQADSKYLAESKAGMKPVDVMEIEWYDRYKAEGRLANLGDIIKDTNFPKVFSSKELDTVAIEHTVKGVAYNTKLVSPKDVPRSWEDLLNPKWKGKIAIEISLDIFTYITKSWGEEKVLAYVKKLKEQNPLFTAGVTHTMTLLGAGEFPLAIEMNLHRLLDLQAKGVPIALAPISPIVDKLSSLVVMGDAPHPNAGRLYMRWLMSAEGQSLVNSVRKKGNPLPGSGTPNSQALEQLGVKIVTSAQWEIDGPRLQGLYHAAIGYTKKTKTMRKTKNR